MIASQTNEKALEPTIEKYLTGTCLEELKEQGISLNILNERVELYRLWRSFIDTIPQSV